MLLKFGENFNCLNYSGLVLWRSSIWKDTEDGPQTPNSGGYEIRGDGLEVVADEDEGGPVVGVGEGVDGELSWDVEADAAIDRFGVFESEAFGDEGLLDLLESLGFGFAGLDLLVKLLHEEGGGGVVDLPKGSDDGFGSIFHEVVTDSCNF